MQKEELIYLHTTLVQVKRFLESEGVEADFSRYESLHISPVHVHRSKTDHMNAIFVLSDEIGRAINPGRDNTTIIGKKDRKLNLLGVKEKGLADLRA
ncbi:metal-binding protein [Methanocella sp. CWC-04]|uniref:Metal-binding protein n=1 Tax=Methanooceanicella nereidis TaxID=2052831 RepID=A0AAP2REB2_9EURY|nr:UPF0058 family protein [Methanocella sp. CWC-04]MCD1294490.1 metal-binding protein [Methanocella sp. CWC-04]